LVASVVISPNVAVRYLGDQFYSPNSSLGHRCEILDLLILSARELSHWQANETSAVPSSNSIIDQTADHLQKKTRRFSRKSLWKSTATGQNVFSNHVSAFLFALLGRYTNLELFHRIFANDGILLEKLIKTIGILLHLAGCHPAAIETTRYVLDFLNSFRFSKQYHIQHATALSIYLIFASLPTYLIFPYFEKELRDIYEWLSAIIDSNPNEIYRQTMTSLLLYLSNLFEEESKNLICL